MATKEHKNPRLLPLMDIREGEERTKSFLDVVRKRKTALTGSDAPASGGHMSQVSKTALGGGK